MTLCLYLCYYITHLLVTKSWTFTLLKSFVYYYNTILLLTLLKVYQGRFVHNDHYPTPIYPNEIHHMGSIRVHISNISLFSSIITCPDGFIPTDDMGAVERRWLLEPDNPGL